MVTTSTSGASATAPSTEAKDSNGKASTTTAFYEDGANLKKLCDFLRSRHGPPVREALLLEKRVHYLKGTYYKSGTTLRQFQWFWSVTFVFLSRASRWKVSKLFSGAKEGYQVAVQIATLFHPPWSDCRLQRTLQESVFITIGKARERWIGCTLSLSSSFFVIFSQCWTFHLACLRYPVFEILMRRDTLLGSMKVTGPWAIWCRWDW